ncbi:MAG: LamG domain-containing protein, partial [Thermoanaerobaculales bacterium]|nr:LamG domain-containing protein [Thermoanaerobaculales bacterium]
SFIDTIGLLGTFNNNTAPLGIGKDGEMADRFAGAIGDLWVYDRELSAGEITGLYNALFIDGFESGSASAWSTISP